MTALDFLAAGFSGLASAALGMRSMILRKDILTKPTAPRLVTFGLMLGAAALGGASFNLWRGAHAEWREVYAYGGVAVSAMILLRNLVQQKRAAA